MNRNPKLLFTIVCIAILALALIYGTGAIAFKSGILGKATDLIAGLSVVVVLVERSLAVINNIVYGEERQKSEEKVQQLKQQKNVTQDNLRQLESTRGNLITRSALEGANIQILSDVVQKSENEISTLRTQQEALVQDISTTQSAITETKSKQATLQLWLGFVAALLLAAVGIRSIEPLVDFVACPANTDAALCSLREMQLGAMRVVDIVLTAGVIAGGSAGLNSISELIKSFVESQRSKNG